MIEQTIASVPTSAIEAYQKAADALKPGESNPFFHSLFSTNASGTQPLSVPMVARTAPFDTFHPMLLVTSGEVVKFPGGQVQTEMPVGAGSSAQVTFLNPLSITSPAVGPLEASVSEVVTPDKWLLFSVTLGYAYGSGIHLEDSVEYSYGVQTVKLSNSDP